MKLPPRLLPAILILCFAHGVCAQSAKDLAARFPVKTDKEESALVEQIAALGPAGIKEICALIQPPGSTDDTAARFAVTALMRQAGRPGHDAMRKTVASAIAQSIDAADDPQVKSFFILRLQEIGGDESVPAIAAYLSDQKLCPVACAALEHIHTPAAIESLARGLSSTDARCLIPITKSLGMLKVQSAAGPIQKHLEDEDPTLHRTAVWALVNMGADAGVEAARAYLQNAPDRSKHSALALMLLAAQRQAEVGKRQQAIELATSVLDAGAAAGESFDHAAGAALHLLADIRGEAALDRLIAAAQSGSIELRAAALDAAAAIPGPATTGRWVQQLKAPGMSPAVRADLLAFLARRGDHTALAAIVEAIGDDDASVRLAAARAAAKLDPDAAVEPLVGLLIKHPAEAPAACEILARMPGDRALDALAAAIKQAPDGSRVVILDTLGARVDKAHKAAVLEQSTAKEAAVRIAALRAMERIGDADDVPQLVKLALGAGQESEEQAALKAAVAAAAKVEPVDRRAEPFLRAMNAAKGPKRSALARALAKIGGPASLEAITADLRSPDTAVREGAIRALTDWPDAAAAPPLLAVAADDATPRALQVLALRGAINATKSSQLSSEQKVQTYARALAAARRPDERKLVLAALAAERTAEALDVAAPLLEDEALRPEAALAVIRIIVPLERRQKGLTGDKAASALEKAIPLCPDAAARSDAQRYLARIAPDKPRP